MNKRIYVVTGLGFGDETKGATVDKLCHTYPDIDLVVRFNGGGQAAHNVVLPSGLHHTFAQWGAGSFVPGTKTLLSRFVLVNPSTLMVEAEALAYKNVPIVDRMFVDERCVITTPFHMLLNRVREQARGVSQHGTTGMGISETVIDAIASPDEVMTAGDLRQGIRKIRSGLDATAARLRPELHRLGGSLEFGRINTQRVAESYVAFSKLANICTEWYVEVLFNTAKGIVMEGAQGVLLDQHVGFHPHTTWSTTTNHNAQALLQENNMMMERITMLGVTRTYHTRHGAGPFPTELSSCRIDLCGFNASEPHNGDEGHAGQFRIGLLDMTLLKYAVANCLPLDGLVVSHLDLKIPQYLLVNPNLHGMCSRDSLIEQQGLTRLAYRPVHCGQQTFPEDTAEFIAEELQLPLFMKAHGPTHEDREIVMEDTYA